tara:strand:+ start:11074 stop:11292 length:219 start_codon:yes stop_codon:yes gene_type:complete
MKLERDEIQVDRKDGQTRLTYDGYRLTFPDRCMFDLVSKLLKTQKEIRFDTKEAKRQNWLMNREMDNRITRG